MSKKGYKKGLPAVLPGEGPQRSLVPAPRRSPEAVVAPAPAPVESPVVRPEGRFVESRVDGPETPEPVGQVETAGPAGQVAPLAPSLPTGRALRSASTLALVLASLVLIGGAAVVVILFHLDSGKEDVDGPGAARAIAGQPAADTSHVTSRVLRSGDVAVHQRIRRNEPISLLSLSLPQVPGVEGMSATQVLVVADGKSVDGPETVTDATASYAFSPAKEVLVRYSLTGAVELSDSVPGRALATATTLDVRYGTPVEQETRVVRASDVLALACSPSPSTPLAPCGGPDRDGGWRVELTGRDVAARVAAQLALR